MYSMIAEMGDILKRPGLREYSCIFFPFVGNGNCFKRVVGVIERFMVGPSKPPLQASMNRKTVSTPGAKSARHIILCGHKLFK